MCAARDALCDLLQSSTPGGSSSQRCVASSCSSSKSRMARWTTHWYPSTRSSSPCGPHCSWYAAPHPVLPPARPLRTNAADTSSVWLLVTQEFWRRRNVELAQRWGVLKCVQCHTCLYQPRTPPAPFIPATTPASNARAAVALPTLTADPLPCDTQLRARGGEEAAVPGHLQAERGHWGV